MTVELIENENENQSDKIDIKKEIFEWIKVVVLAFSFAFIITRFVTPSLVKGTSMYPTFNENDYLIVNKVAYKSHLPEYGDIILFNSNFRDERVLIKRVIAKENDTIQIKDSKVYVNGKEIKEDYIYEDIFWGEIDAVVPEGKVFVMGDNRNNSADSRVEDIGFIDKEDIIGKVEFRLFPFNKIGSQWKD